MARSRFVLTPSVALLVAAGASPARAQQRVDVTTRRPSAAAPEADSPVRRLQHQLDSLTQLYTEGGDVTQSERKRIEGEIGRTVEQLAVIMSRLSDAPVQARMFLKTPVASALTLPRGWIGIVTEGPGMEPRVENGEIVVRYLAYPRIVSVDPSSPAQAAGIVPNDTLVAYDGRDVRDNDIYLNRLLRPNAKVSVRLRRDGRVRDVPVIVAETPSRVTLRRSDEVNDDRTITVTPSPDGNGITLRQLAPAAPRPGGRVAAGLAPTIAPMPAMPRMPGSLNFIGITGVAGAQLGTISEGLGKRLGVSGGVLVISAPAGSPASESGLEDGDVLVKVGELAVRSVLDVRRAVAQAYENGQHSVDVVLLRDTRTVKTSLKW